MTRPEQFIAGGYGRDARDVGTLVNWQICQSKDGSGVGLSEFEDGFRSFRVDIVPVIAFAGLVYLSLFLAGKFSVGIPSSSVISSRCWASNQGPTSTEPRSNPLAKATSSRSHTARKQAAAPPIYLIVLILIPIGAAIYIASTRYADDKHHGFDVLFSSIEGALCAWFGFRLYHLPVHRAAGWSWGPRSRNKALGIGIGAAGYVDTESGVDLENGVLTEQNIGRAHQEGNNWGGDSIGMDNLRGHHAVGSSSSQRPLREE
ncbi:hypothetical protein VE02_02021 [Pseudogymnoascus sp. 03VT05]|nr:hypothetical protein VE02_02021 [Pseudogymnoascus sp. 03VT05]